MWVRHQGLQRFGVHAQEKLRELLVGALACASLKRGLELSSVNVHLWSAGVRLAFNDVAEHLVDIVQQTQSILVLRAIALSFSLSFTVGLSLTFDLGREISSRGLV